MFWRLFSYLRVCSVSVTASGVFSYAGKLFWGFKSGPERSRNAKTHVHNYFVICWWSFWGKYKYINILSKLAQPGFRSGPGGRGCCAKERVLFGEGSLAYAAGVLRNTPRVITTQREPKGSQKGAKGSQKGAKGSQKGTKGTQKGAKGSQKGAKDQENH